jgi:pimeloyl-ACP methyl ester carboxylesterase
MNDNIGKSDNPEIFRAGKLISRRQFIETSAAGTAFTALGIGMAANLFAADNPATGSSAIAPFTIDIPQSALDDLKRRLDLTRWPNHQTVSDWSQGVPLEKARALVEYWRAQYDWRRTEKKINGFAQYRTEIDGVGIHFIHVRSKHEDALPVILTHGWPGSIVEFLKVINPLTNPTAHGGKPEDAFHVVVPSLPGFGFSDKPADTGWDVVRIARAWAVLMQRLGYRRWVAQGGDWGAGVTTALGKLKPAGLAGIHLNFQFVFPEKIPTEGLSVEEQRAVTALTQFLNDGNGYFREQTTRPQTIAYGLADSPSGQATWIYEKFQAWTDCNGDPETVFTKDEMLDNISLYWLTDTAASSARIYWENRTTASPSGGVISIPVAASVFPHEIWRTPRSWAEQNYTQLVYWSELDKGGHFAAFEQPELFTQELRNGFKKLR